MTFKRWVLGAVVVGMALGSCSKENTITTNNETNDYSTLVSPTTITLGPEGGSLEGPDGVVLEVPPGALTVVIEIAVGVVRDEGALPALPDGMEAVSEIYGLLPADQRFDEDARLTLPFDGDADDDVVLLQALPGGSWQPVELESVDDGTVTAAIDGLGFFVVATATPAAGEGGQGGGGGGEPGEPDDGGEGGSTPLGTAGGGAGGAGGAGGGSAGAAGGSTETLPDAPPPVIEPDSGTERVSLTITMSSEVEGAEIRYTTDGTDPTASSTLYEEPFELKRTATVRARVFADAMRPSPVVEATYSIIPKAIDVSAMWQHTLVLMSDGTIRAFGYNLYGRLGYATEGDYSSVPGTVSGITTAAAVSAGTGHSMALLEDGTVMTWGTDYSGELGRELLSMGSGDPGEVEGLAAARAVSAGGGFCLALLVDGTLAAWGNNQYGHLGDGTDRNRSSPVSVQAIEDASFIASSQHHSLSVLQDGTIRGFGYNAYGQLGNEDTAAALVPVEVLGVANAKEVSASWYHSLAVTTDGAVLAWGRNNSGQLGVGGDTGSTVPVEVPGITGAVAVAAGDNHSLALLADGTVLGWGSNDDGQLGDGTSTASDVPIPVPGIEDAVAIAAGAHQSHALLEDGTILSWGANTLGWLGDGTTDRRRTPVPVVWDAE